MLCRDSMDDRLTRLTCLHAPSSYHNRQFFWDELRSISNANTLPWLCAGDFNEILYPWMNNCAGDELVKERLDRVLSTVDWRLQYPAAEVFALPSLGSDHCPLLLSTSATHKKGRRPFLFEAYWLHDQECRDVIWFGDNSTTLVANMATAQQLDLSLPVSRPQSGSSRCLST